MANSNTPTGSTAERISQSVSFAETVAQRKVALLKLDAAEKIAKSGSGFVVLIILMVLSSVTMLTLNIGLGFLIAELSALSVGTSLLLLTLFYVLLMGLLIWQRHRFFTNPILATLVKKLF